MCLAAIGLVVVDVNFILVDTFAAHLQGGYWYFIVGPLIDGCVGGRQLPAQWRLTIFDLCVDFARSDVCGCISANLSV